MLAAFCDPTGMRPHHTRSKGRTGERLWHRGAALQEQCHKHRQRGACTTDLKGAFLGHFAPKPSLPGTPEPPEAAEGKARQREGRILPLRSRRWREVLPRCPKERGGGWGKAPAARQNTVPWAWATRPGSVPSTHGRQGGPRGNFVEEAEGGGERPQPQPCSVGSSWGKQRAFAFLLPGWVRRGRQTVRGVGKGTFPRGLLPVRICPGSSRLFQVASWPETPRGMRGGGWSRRLPLQAPSAGFGPRNFGERGPRAAPRQSPEQAGEQGSEGSARSAPAKRQFPPSGGIKGTPDSG